MALSRLTLEFGCLVIDVERPGDVVCLLCAYETLVFRIGYRFEQPVEHYDMLAGENGIAYSLNTNPLYIVYVIAWHSILDN